MATLDDVLTTQKNGVIAINNLGITLKSYNEGQYTSATVSTPTVIVSGAGRLINAIIVTPGTTAGYIYNFASITSPPASNALMPLSSTLIGVYPIGAKFSVGIVIVPGTGQSVNVTYSLD